MPLRFELIASLLALSACSEADIRFPDGGGGGDAGGGVDAGDFDAAGTDAGTTPDGGGLDTGPDDAGSSDAGPVPGVGDLVITEMMIDTAAVPDDDGEWFELNNTSTDTTYDLDGCSFADDGNIYFVRGSTPVAPGAYFVAARTGAAGITAVTPHLYGDTVKFSNDTPDSLTINCAGTVIDRVQYNPGTWPVVRGASLTLDPASIDSSANDDPSSWCVGTVVYNSDGESDRGSPGMANMCP